MAVQLGLSCKLQFAKFLLIVSAGTVSIDQDLFWQQGFLWFRGFVSHQEVEAIRASVTDMLDRWSPGTLDPNSSLARSSLRLKEPDHNFLLDSATKASFFLETRAVDDAIKGLLQDVESKRRAVRKVAHGLHLFEGPMQDVTQRQDVAKIAQALGLKEPVIVQSVYRLASPLAPGVDRHQDSTTLYTEPPSVLGFWLALEDTDESSGCLRLRPGSHREPIRERLVRQTAADGRINLVFQRRVNATAAPDSDFQSLEMAKGDLLVMHGAMEHFSSAGVDPRRTRESFQVHIVENMNEWSAQNWLQYPAEMKFVKLADSKDAREDL